MKKNIFVTLVLLGLIAVVLLLMFSLLRRPRDKAIKSTAPSAARVEDIAKYIMPPEEALHEGTWLQWPHNYGYDRKHIQRYEATWIHMARELSQGENVHIIAYDGEEKRPITAILENDASTNMRRVDFLIGRRMMFGYVTMDQSLSEMFKNISSLCKTGCSMAGVKRLIITYVMKYRNW